MQKHHTFWDELCDESKSKTTMLQGDNEYFECHNCGQLVSRPTLLSGNVCGAELYSDGKLITPMLPEFPQISKCAKCQTISWLDDGNKVDINCLDEIKGIQANFLSPEDLDRAIKNGLAFDRGRERFLRQRILWGINDRLRFGLSLFPNYETRHIWEENCNAILNLTDESKVDHCILKAEIYRYYGKFKKSKQLIESINAADHQWLIPLYLKEINEESRRVFRLYEQNI